MPRSSAALTLTPPSVGGPVRGVRVIVSMCCSRSKPPSGKSSIVVGAWTVVPFSGGRTC